MIIRRNFGANSFIIGRDHASPGAKSGGEKFYEPFAARDLAEKHSSEVGMNVLSFDEYVYISNERRYVSVQSAPPSRNIARLSGTIIRDEYLANGKSPPEWMMRKEVSKILVEASPPRTRQGLCLWFTGLSGAGKSTTAEIVTALLSEEGRQVTLLDGDVVRTHLSRGLGFTKEDRDINISRIGFVASEIVRHGGIAVCAAVSPYRDSRNKVRSMFESEHFIEIFVDTPFEICESRDPKGMYAKARRGEIENFTGIDDIYEIPDAAEITLNTVEATARENAELMIRFLRSKGFLAGKRRDRSDVVGETGALCRSK
jgi:sulfate adenylyltransferase